MDRKEIAEEIKATEEKLADLRAQLEEKPKLRHGAGGIANDNDPFVVIEQGTLEGSPKAFYASGMGQVNVDKYPDENKVLIPNIFDDLKALAEPLEEFNLGCLRVHISPQNGCMYIDDDDGDGLRVPKDDLDEFSMAVRRLILTKGR